ncbi:MAG: hypothetical protein QXV32_02110 [Conexivisphaerales archaeon]
MVLKSWHIEEPKLLFGDGQSHVDQKSGLLLFGPYTPGAEEKSAPSSIRLGIIGTGQTIELARRWLQKCQTGVSGDSSQLALRPPFSGFENVFGCTLRLSKQWEETIPERDIDSTVRISSFGERVRMAVKLFTDKLRNFSEREPRPQVVICALPKEIVDACGTQRGGQGRVRLSPAERKLKKEIERNRIVGQQTLVPLDEVELGLSDFLPEFSDFRRILKADAMEIGIPTQIAWPGTFTGEQASGRMVQDETTRAWNFSVALYYKGGGFPWRLAEARQGTCYVGVSFYKERGSVGERTRTSLAQIFTHTGEGLVLRGGRFAWDEKRGKSPHLSEDSAFQLLSEALNLYQRQMGAPPLRIVVHKSSRYWQDELAGFRKAAAKTSRIDFLAFGERGIRFLRKGSYPPLRGTAVELSSGNYILYTRGYVPYYGTYLGQRVPQPIEITEHYGDSDADTICREVMALTKMNWNNSDFSIREPITLQFAREVGLILAHLREGVEPRPQYLYYM